MIEINSKSIRAMAERMANSGRVPGLNKAGALELLAHGFGYRNFDTFSALLKKEERDGQTSPCEAAVALCREGTLWIGVFSPHEAADSPEWARVSLTPVFLALLGRLRKECREKRYLLVSFDEAPCDWDGGDGEFDSVEWQLCVSKFGFWFQGTPFNGRLVETRFVYWEALEQTAPSDDIARIIGEHILVHYDLDEFLERILEQQLEKAGYEDVAEWVGLHYKVNFDAESEEQQLDYLMRYMASHQE